METKDQRSKLEIEMDLLEKKGNELMTAFIGEFAKSCAGVVDKYNRLLKRNIDPFKAPTDPHISDFIQAFNIGSSAPAASTEKKPRAARGSYPEATVESVTAAIKSAGGSMKAGDLSSKFGLGQWSKKSKDLAKSFSIKKEGVTKFWAIK